MTTTTAPLSPTERDSILEAVYSLLGELREVLHHESAEPGNWAHESSPDGEMTEAAVFTATRVINEAEKTIRVVRRAEAAARLRAVQAAKQTGGQPR
ncbi:hypothetical protein ACFT0G_06045 [Streptomyces sp. NPDC057020]|uniref:hypothetical protein n=1 Tax=unclassified Streptomyces TaxID=2593676 RepID=UPI0036267942